MFHPAVCIQHSAVCHLLPHSLFSLVTKLLTVFRIQKVGIFFIYQDDCLHLSIPIKLLFQCLFCFLSVWSFFFFKCGWCQTQTNKKLTGKTHKIKIVPLYNIRFLSAHHIHWFRPAGGFVCSTQPEIMQKRGDSGPARASFWLCTHRVWDCPLKDQNG